MGRCIRGIYLGFGSLFGRRQYWSDREHLGQVSKKELGPEEEFLEGVCRGMWP